MNRRTKAGDRFSLKYQAVPAASAATATNATAMGKNQRLGSLGGAELCATSPGHCRATEERSWTILSIAVA